jgi:hypothetical protein
MYADLGVFVDGSIIYATKSALKSPEQANITVDDMMKSSSLPLSNLPAGPVAPMSNDFFGPGAPLSSDFFGPGAPLSGDFFGPGAPLSGDFSGPGSPLSSDFSSPDDIPRRRMNRKQKVFEHVYSLIHH